MLLWLATRPKVSGKAVERIIGHCVHIFMLRREFLSVFRAVYDFKLAHYKHPSRLWRSAAKEFRWAAALLLVCNSNLERPWSDTATASDASLSGTAVSMLRSSSETTQAIGVCREMWRFKSKDPLNRARDAVLKLDPFADVLSVKPILGEKSDPFQINSEFEHVPQSFACDSGWTTQFATRMRHPEHITLLEARGSLQAIRHKLRSSKNFGLKHLHLGDNLGMTLAFDRGRAKSVPLLMCCRRAAAYCVAGQCSFIHRWIPSEWNPADGPSRQWEAQRVPTCSKRQTQKLSQAICYPSKQNRHIQKQGWELILGAASSAEKECGATEDQSSTIKERPPQEYRGQGRSNQVLEAKAVDRQGSHFRQIHGADNSGSGCGGTTYGRRVQAQALTFSRVLPCSEVEAAKADRRGSCFDPLSQPVFHRGMVHRGGKQVPRCSNGLDASSLQTGPHSKSEVSARLDQSGPGTDSSSCGVAAHCADRASDGRKWFSSGSSGSSADVCDIRAPWRDLHHPAQGLGGKPLTRDGLGDQPSCVRRFARFKGQRLKRDHPAQQSGGAMARTSAKLYRDGSRGASHPQQLPTGARCLDQCSEKTPAQDQSGSVPAQALRGQLGQVSQLSRHSGGEASGEMEFRSQCASLRAARSGGSAVRTTGASDKAKGVGSSKCTPVNGPWKMRPFASAPLKKCLELFSGCAVLSRTFCQHGFAAEAWDIEYNSFCDLSNPEVLTSILDRIRAREFSYVHLGTPCTTWSRARRDDGRGPPPLRDDHANLFGFSQLTTTDQSKVRMGNSLLNISIEVFLACMEANVAVSMENPASSRIWLTPDIQTLLHKGASFQHTTFCAFGTPWRKATSFLTWGCPNFNLPSCQGTFAKCSFTNKAHLPLVGRTAEGHWRTRIAQPYPLQLCNMMVKAFRP